MHQCREPQSMSHHVVKKSRVSCETDAAFRRAAMLCKTVEGTALFVGSLCHYCYRCHFTRANCPPTHAKKIHPTQEVYATHAGLEKPMYWTIPKNRMTKPAINGG